MTGSTAPGDRALAGRGGSQQPRPPAAPRHARARLREGGQHRAGRVTEFLAENRRRLRASATAAAEHALWQRTLRSARVKVLPGKAFACPLPGWFRLCHATDAGTVATGINLIRALETS
jgi:hypothetical protein